MIAPAIHGVEPFDRYIGRVDKRWFPLVILQVQLSGGICAGDRHHLNLADNWNETGVGVPRQHARRVVFPQENPPGRCSARARKLWFRSKNASAIMPAIRMPTTSSTSRLPRFSLLRVGDYGGSAIAVPRNHHP